MWHRTYRKMLHRGGEQWIGVLRWIRELPSVAGESPAVPGTLVVVG